MGTVTASGATAALVEWAVASRAHAAHTESGDRHVVAPFVEGVLVGVVDGLGHGEAAAAAASRAVTLLDSHRGDSLAALVERCHAELQATRGAVMSLASFHAREGTLAWLGVGNVAGVVLRADPDAGPSRVGMLNRGGVVGFQLPELRPSIVPLARGDVLVLATDGVRSDFGWRMSAEGSPQRMADRVLSECARPPDDALVLVARYLGGTS